MSKLTRLKEHIHALDDINNIMKAMKNHALFEINKMTKYISTQDNSINTIKEVGRDFFKFYPAYFEMLEETAPVICLLIGSERGFCGNFNDIIIQQLRAFEENNPDKELKLIIVGRKLAVSLAGDPRIIREMAGYETAEEIPGVILTLVNTLEAISLELNIKQHPALWRFFFNTSSNDRMETATLQPFVEFAMVDDHHLSFSPILNVSAERFVFEFINHYLLSTLYFVFYRSFITENYQRLHHLDNALGRLENNIKQMTQHLNMVRQEDITQEIEVIMLSVEAIINEKLVGL